MQTALLASLLVLSATVAAATRRSRQEPAGATEGEFYPDRESEKTCEELCKEDAGIDGDPSDCLTECAVHTDLTTHHENDGIEDFAEDEAYNEKGGEGIEEKAEADHPVEVLDCAPQVDIDKTPDISEIDTKKDGVIDEEEAKEWGHKACVPDEMTEQIFNQADANCDHVISQEEFTDSGEDTAQEQAVDEALEEHSEGDDEYNNVQSPPLEEFDENNDGGLDPEEHKEAVKFEMERREEGGVADAEVPQEKADEAFDTVDTDGNGLVEGDEYEEPAADGGSDMGEEIIEAAKADEDATDPDDLSRAGEQAAAPAAAAGSAASASMLSTRFKVAQRNEAAFLRRFNIPERNHVSTKKRSARKSHPRSFGHFGHAFVELARKHRDERQKHHAQKHRVERRKTMSLRSHPVSHSSLRRHRKF